MKKKKIEDIENKKLIAATCMSSENACLYSAGRWWHQQTNWSPQANKQTKVFQKIASPEVSKLNQAVINKNKEIECRSFL